MLARLARTLPEDGPWFFEPKWDGFRALVFREAGDVDIRSRNHRPFSRYFPELVEAFEVLPEKAFVVDGEIMLPTGGGYDFATLMTRLHPAASRVRTLAAEHPATFVAFDVLAIGAEELLAHPFRERRSRLEALVPIGTERLAVTPGTPHAADAQRWLDLPSSAGIDGVVAKHADAPYEPGVRAMVKIKHEWTLDAAVAGFRVAAAAPEVASLLLGLYDPARTLRHIGVASSFGRPLARQLFDELRLIVAPLAGHPWEHGFALEGGPMGRLRGAAGRWTPEMALDWVPVRPMPVCEVAYGQVDGWRLRHPSRFRRWRPDRDADSCTLDQLDRRGATTHG
jgi:ATP-dependent DNA ligase